MIVRILNEGQWELDEEAVRGLNALDDAVEQAVNSGDQEQLSQGSAQRCSTGSGRTGTAVPDDDLQNSDLILPDCGLDHRGRTPAAQRVRRGPHPQLSPGRNPPRDDRCSSRRWTTRRLITFSLEA